MLINMNIDDIQHKNVQLYCVNASSHFCGPHLGKTPPFRVRHIFCKMLPQILHQSTQNTLHGAIASRSEFLQAYI